MKILIAASIYPPDPGGPSIHAYEQFNGFARRGDSVKLVALTHLMRWPIGIRHIIYLFKLISKGFSCDIIYAHDPLGVGLPVFVASKLLRKKYILRIGGDLIWERKAERGETNLSFLEWYGNGEHKKTASFFLCRLVMNGSSCMVVPSHILSNVYTKYYGIEKGKINVISNPFPIVDQTLEVKRNPYFIYASRLVGYKNLEFVIRVFSKISKDYPLFKFLIMGSGQDREKLENLTEKLAMGKNVIFKGSVPQSEVLKMTAEASFAIGPALTEFNPLYILQSIAYQKPFLISREHGFTFTIPEEFLFDPRNENEFEHKLRYLLSPEGYKRASELVKDIKLENSWEDVLDRNHNLIHKVAST